MIIHQHHVYWWPGTVRCYALTHVKHVDEVSDDSKSETKNLFLWWFPDIRFYILAVFAHQSKN